MSEAPMPPTVTITVTPADLNLISAALGKLPAEQVFNLLISLKSQFEQQRNQFIIESMAPKHEAMLTVESAPYDPSHDDDIQATEDAPCL